NVGVSPALICAITLEAGAVGLTHRPFAGSVWQTESTTGSDVPPVSTVAVIDAPDPTFTEATEKKPMPVLPGILTMPSFVMVPASATTSGTGVADAVKSSVFTSGVVTAGSVLSQSNVNSIVVAANACVGVNARTNVRQSPAGIFTGVFACPTSAPVVRSVT